MRRYMIVAGLLWIVACAQQPVAAPTPAAQPAAEVPAAAPAHEDFQTYCTHAACQHDVDIDLTQADGNKYHRHFSLMPPTVQPQLITVYPGQTVKAAAAFKDGQFTGWTTVPAAQAGDVVLTFKLEQGAAGMMLSVHNDSGKQVKLALYKVDLQHPDDDPAYTSSCPVLAGGDGFETWPESIFEIDVRSADISAASACN